MSFKRRLASFIGKKDSKADSDINTHDLSYGPAVAKFKHVDELPSDPQLERETMDGIEQDYFEGYTFDASKYELQKLPDILVLQDIDDDRNKLRKQLQAVCKKVSDVVLENHPAYAAELQRVMELQKTLQKANTICTQGRKQLTEAKQVFTSISLGLLSNYRKRQQLLLLLKSLRTIKTLQRTDIRLREMLEEDDYPGAIQLCLECQKAASTYRHYHCISELSSKLQDTLEMIEEQLDVALSKTCIRFEQKHYEKVQAAYALLSKIQTAMDQLHMHYASAIHNTAFNIVLGYAELYTGTASSNFQKKQYSDLCNNITVECFTPCLIDLCKALWEVMKSYHQTMQWHRKQDQEVHEFESTPTDRVTFNKNYVKQKLDHGLGRIWQDVQQKIKKYILSTDLASFKYDEFIQVLDIVNRLIQIGEEFCGSKSETLHESIRTQTVNYFRNFHRAKLEELKVFLENEGWELCPVKNNFEINQLHEFKFLRKARRQRPFNPDTSSLTSTSSSSRSFFEKYASQGSPFDQLVEDEEREDVLDVNWKYTSGSDSDDDVPDELKQDFIDEQTGETPMHRTNFKGSRKNTGKRAPIITNTTLNVIRLFGKYMQTMNVLKPIAFDVILCMSQLFDFYLYAVYVFFGSEAMNESTLSNKLNTTLTRIRDSLIADNSDESSMASVITDGLDKIPQPFLSSVVDLHDPRTLCGLTEKIVAVESLVFLAEQFNFLQPYLESAIPPAKIPFLQQFYSQTISTAHELRHPIYRNVGAACIDYSYILNQMGSVKWDIKDIMSQHSPYVDTILYEFETFSCRLKEINHRVPIPKSVYDIIWDHCVTLANKQFVEGYGLVKKCSNEGRALMQLDFQQFLTKLEKLTDIRPIPGREFVEVYIKAYYLPDDQLEMWIRDHKEYSNKQIMSLLHCVPHINRKTRQKLVAMLEDNITRK